MLQWATVLFSIDSLSCAAVDRLDQSSRLELWHGGLASALCRWHDVVRSELHPHIRPVRVWLGDESLLCAIGAISADNAADVVQPMVRLLSAIIEPTIATARSLADADPPRLDDTDSARSFVPSHTGGLARLGRVCAMQLVHAAASEGCSSQAVVEPHDATIGIAELLVRLLPRLTAVAKADELLSSAMLAGALLRWPHAKLHHTAKLCCTHTRSRTCVPMYMCIQCAHAHARPHARMHTHGNIHTHVHQRAHSHMHS